MEDPIFAMMVHYAEIAGKLKACDGDSDRKETERLSLMAAERLRPGAWAWISGAQGELQVEMEAKLKASFDMFALGPCEVGGIIMGHYETLASQILENIERYSYQ